MVGPHQVRFWPAEGGADRDADSGRKMNKMKKDAIPGRYHVNTELKFDVPAAGTTEANFTLTSP